MVAASMGRCPVCGRVHMLPNARSFSRKKMGCNREMMGFLTGFNPDDDGSTDGPTACRPDQEQ